jgi:hypothetical protein
MPGDVMTAKEVAEYLKIDQSTVTRLAKANYQAKKSAISGDSIALLLSVGWGCRLIRKQTKARVNRRASLLSRPWPSRVLPSRQERSFRSR